MIKQPPAMAASRHFILWLGTFFVLQAAVVVLHEFTHATTAWLLGEMPSPLGIVWGNPLTMTGWDEGVDYTRIFRDGPGWHGSVIGFMPIVMHSAAVAAALWLMRGEWLPKRRWLFNGVYWLTVVNLMELVAYIYMRAFSGHGDIGNFDVGLGISPWWMFLFGSAVLTWALWLFYRHALPRMQALFADGGPASAWALLILTSFLLFLWGSGIRVMAYVEGPQWTFGLLGFAGFGAALWLFRPELQGRQI